jgi:hypothetical protein
MSYSSRFIIFYIYVYELDEAIRIFRMQSSAAVRCYICFSHLLYACCGYFCVFFGP